MARYFDITVRNDKTSSSTSFWADRFSLNDNAILSVYSRDCGNIKVKIEKYETLTIETVDVKEEWEEMMEHYEQIGKRENCDLKNYIEGQMIGSIRTQVYSTIAEQAELKPYREFGNLSQLRVLCDNYHELMSRPTEAEIRAKAIEEFAERCKELVKQGELYDYVRWCNWNNSVFKWFDRVAEQLKEEH